MQLDLMLLMKGLAIGFMLVGLAVHLGFWKGWYWRSRGGAYAYIPMGIVFMMYSYQSFLIEKLGMVPTVVLFFLFVAIILWFTLKPPEILKPRWVLWVEKYPNKVRRAMTQEVLDGEKWEPWVKSEAEVDAWAARVAKKLPKDK